MEQYQESQLQLISLIRQIIQDDPQNLDILTNIEQIKRLKWLGEYGMDKRKQGKWVAIWNGEVLSDIEGYFENGFRKGLWKELFKKYFKPKFLKVENTRMIKEVEYGYISMITIKCQKNGKWIELSDDFNCNSQLPYIGEYRNGQKVGKQDIWYKNYQIGKNEQMQSYMEKENIMVVVDSMKKVMNSKQFEDGLRLVISSMTLLKLLIMVNIKREEKLVDGIFISKLQEGMSRQVDNKITKEVIKQRLGEKVRLSDSFFQDIQQDLKVRNEQMQKQIFSIYQKMIQCDSNSQVTCIGEYKNGQKQGRWDMYYNYGVNNRIGGGLYEDGEHGVKIGKWIELSNINTQLTYIGEYKKGQKVGKWDTYFNYFGNKQIGGGLYDEEGEGIKIGRWIEVNDEFFDSSQGTLNGEYKNGGGGSNDQVSVGIKIWIWIEIKDNFKWALQTTLNGEYENGKKIGTWIEMHGNIKSKEINFEH
ncbi:unnamed protein product [Paramecium pentaurelia]|uniref:MORN repeat protein n=1 Tax=Paramecium pentaurelia TaxID=43138 RepID=A0A8S1XPI8_9CILI|nr:unnamed protein product [Paramecium pentaurelia]